MPSSGQRVFVEGSVYCRTARREPILAGGMRIIAFLLVQPDPLAASSR